MFHSLGYLLHVNTVLVTCH